jgi:hypothetical protein
MLDSLAQALFGTYFGLDWASMLFGFWGAWLIGNKNPLGFLLTSIAVLLASLTALIAAQYGFLVANAISLAIAWRNWRLWTQPS